MRVSQLINDRGNAAANQFVIYDNDGNCTFQSYRSTIATIKGDKVELYRDWDYSNTTRKHLYIFLRDFAQLNVRSKADLLAHIKNGTIVKAY